MTTEILADIAGIIGWAVVFYFFCSQRAAISAVFTGIADFFRRAHTIKMGGIGAIAAQPENATTSETMAQMKLDKNAPTESSTPQPQDGGEKIKPIDKNAPTESSTSQLKDDEEKKKRAIEKHSNQIPNRPVFIEQEKISIKELEEKGVAVAGENATVKMLVKNIAGLEVLYKLQRAYNFIFGSQITALKKINERGGRVYPSYLKEYHESVKKDFYGMENSDEERYFSFLFSHDLIGQDNDRVYITELGREFLLWLAYSGTTDKKPF